LSGIIGWLYWRRKASHNFTPHHARTLHTSASLRNEPEHVVYSARVFASNPSHRVLNIMFTLLVVLPPTPASRF
ncbi:unnamed protein product, partial [Ixodes persulcatus]